MDQAEAWRFKYDGVQDRYLHELQKVCPDRIGKADSFKWDKNHGEPRFAYQPIHVASVYDSGRIPADAGDRL